MRTAVFAALLLTSATGAAAQDLFSRLDRDGDGYLSNAETQAELARGSGWIAIDRDNDERFSRDEFQAVTAARGEEALARSAETELTQARGSGYSARRLIGMQARDFSGRPAGVVSDILVNPDGAVTGLVVDGERVPWIRVGIGPRATYVAVPHQSASAGATFGTGEALPRRGEWLASQFLDDVVQLERGRRYVNVDDLIITPWGEVSAIVVDAGPSGAPPGRYSYPWRRDVHSRIRDPRPFDYAARGITPP